MNPWLLQCTATCQWDSFRPKFPRTMEGGAFCGPTREQKASPRVSSTCSSPRWEAIGHLFGTPPHEPTQ